MARRVDAMSGGVWSRGLILSKPRRVGDAMRYLSVQVRRVSRNVTGWLEGPFDGQHLDCLVWPSPKRLPLRPPWKRPT
jgi:hypothetical protein